MFVSTALFAAIATAPAADVQTLAGKKFSGDLVSIDRQAIVLRSASGELAKIPVGETLAIETLPNETPPRGAHTAVELTDGTVLLCSQVSVNGNVFELTVLPDLKVKVPTTAVFTILRDAHDPKVRHDWQNFLSKRGQLDMVVVRSDDKLNGLEGAFGAGTGESIDFTPNSTGQKRSIRLNRAQGLIFVQKPNPEAPAPLCRITDGAGNLLVAADVVLNDSGLTITTVSGAKVQMADAKRLAKLDFSKGKLAYLSELTPSRESVTLATEDDDQYARFVRYRKDLNLENGQLRLRGKAYARGITMHAGTQLTYAIGGDYKELRAVLGVDDGVETQEPVEVVIEGDARELYRGQISRKDEPKPLAVDIRGVRDLRISVRAKGLLDFGAQAALADAKVSK